MPVLPRRSVPPLAFETVDRGRFDLAERRPEHFTLVVVYRGHHCPLCEKQLRELDTLHARFAEKGIELVAVSTNDRELAEATVRDWELEHLTVGYGLTLEDGAHWGLFASAAVKDAEPATFLEPGLFVVRPDGTLYASLVQTMPFSRPTGEQLLGSLAWIAENDYPARGELSHGD